MSTDTLDLANGALVIGSVVIPLPHGASTTGDELFQTTPRCIFCGGDAYGGCYCDKPKEPRT